MEIYIKPNRIIENYQYQHPALRNITDIIVSLINIKSGKVLDVGSGLGRISVLLSKKGYRVDAVDSANEIIDIAKEYAKNKKVVVNFLNLDFSQDIQYLDKEQYDLIICCEVLEHVENYKNMIKNIYNSLKRGAILIVTVPNDPNQYSILDSYGGHLRRFTIPELKESLKDFRIIDCFTIGFPLMRMITCLEIFLLKTSGKQHFPDDLWLSFLFRKVLCSLIHKLIKIDNFFIRLNKGTNIVCKAMKS